MTALLTRVNLSSDDQATLSRLVKVAEGQEKADERCDRYYEGRQRLEQIGIAVPPELRRFETVVNWPRVVVDEVANRLDVRRFSDPGTGKTLGSCEEAWRANSLESHSPLMHKETLTFGRGFVSVSTNEDDAEQPIITVEPPREMSALVDSRRRSMVGAMRRYRDAEGNRRRTLYLPDSTTHLLSGRRGWEVVDRDEHRLGRVPVVLFLNRRRLGSWAGVTEMADAIPLTDAAARSLTNLQVAQEGLAVPGRYIFGIDPKKMVDQHGKPIPLWEAYYTSLMAHADKDVKAGQFDAAQLDNFHKTVEHYGALVSSVSGLPMRYFARSTVNPAAEGAIRADESRLVKNAERKQTDFGDGWAWVMGIRQRFITGEWVRPGSIETDWFDPGTPTQAERSDAAQKLAGGIPILSREGAWDELRWSETRKNRERAYFEAESGSDLLGLYEVKEAARGGSDSAATPGERP